MNSDLIFTAENIAQIVLVFGVCFYLVETWFGYRFMKALVAIVGFFAGFTIGFVIAMRLYQKDAYIPAVAGILVGILLALVAFKLYLVGVFLYCGSIAAGAVAQLPINGEYWLKLVLCAAAFIVVGILAVRFARLAIILITSISGAFGAVNLLRTPVVQLDSNLLLRLAVIAAIAVSGILIQQLTAKNR